MNPPPRTDRSAPGRDLARLGEGQARRRSAWRIVLALCLLYAAGFALFYPRIPTNDDEAMYLRQAQLILQGRSSVFRIDPFSGEVRAFLPSSYAVGTAALMAPCIWAAGPRGAFVVPMLSFLAGVLLTARWIADEGGSPLFSLLVLGFVPALVMGRVCMSDAPSLAVVAFGLWLFWRGLGAAGPQARVPARGWWLGAGFVAGASLLFRPTNALIFAPLFAGTVLRRERRCLLLVIGGLAGTSLRLLAHTVYFGTPFFERATYLFSPETILDRFPLYLFGLLVLFPGGLVAAFAYRGRRRPELAATVTIFFLFYLLQIYGMQETGLPRRVVLALRYFLPLLPIFAFATAEVAPRAWAACLPARPERRLRWERGASRLLAAGLAGLACAAAGVHVAFDRWSATQARIAEALERHADLDRVLVTNVAATRKFLREIDRHYLTLDHHNLRPGDIEWLVARHGEIVIALLDRTDSDFFRRNARDNAALIAGISPPPRLEVDLRVSPIEHLRIWRLERSRPPGKAAETATAPPG
jgi:4-amino-4-deoxy-L-arabinose transferase-like glycosyltransferase